MYRARSGFRAYASGVPRVGGLWGVGPCLDAEMDEEEDGGGGGTVPEDVAFEDDGPLPVDGGTVDWYLQNATGTVRDNVAMQDSVHGMREHCERAGYTARSIFVTSRIEDERTRLIMLSSRNVPFALFTAAKRQGRSVSVDRASRRRECALGKTLSKWM